MQWPTPTAAHGRHTERAAKWAERHKAGKEKGLHCGMPLGVAAELWPCAETKSEKIPEALQKAKPGWLNPSWIEKLMGFAAGYTDVDAEITNHCLDPTEWHTGEWEYGMFRQLPSGTGKRPKDWVNRIRALGNAVVPQCAEWIGQRIASYQAEQDIPW
mgnify:FL=1|tara:strand:- start:59 stop:532 length:474 start_codon:yes stop_codon:yes gene_type:complete